MEKYGYNYQKNMNTTINSKLSVWWNPQLRRGIEPLYIPVNSIEEGIKVMDLLSAYDAFQFQNNVKPDYINVGGIEMYKDGEWVDFYIETEDWYCDDITEYRENCDAASELENFRNELFKQIDWKKIAQMEAEDM